MYITHNYLPGNKLLGFCQIGTGIYSINTMRNQCGKWATTAAQWTPKAPTVHVVADGRQLSGVYRGKSEFLTAHPALKAEHATLSIEIEKAHAAIEAHEAYIQSAGFIHRAAKDLDVAASDCVKVSRSEVDVLESRADGARALAIELRKAENERYLELDNFDNEEWDLNGDGYDEIVFLHAATRERAREVEKEVEALEAEVDLAEKRHYVMTVGGRCIRQQAKTAHTDVHIKEAALAAAKVALESLIVARISAGERILALESTPEPHIGASELVKTNGRKRRHTNHRD